MALTERANESVGKSTWHIRDFLQEMVSRGELTARKILRTRTGIRLEPSEKLEELRPVILSHQSTNADYFFNTESEGGMFTDEGDQSQYENAILQRLAKKFTLKILTRNIGGLYIPEKLILAELHVSYTDHWHDAGDIDIRDSRTGSLKIKGQADELIEKVYGYLRE